MKTKTRTSKIILTVMLMFTVLFNSCDPNEGIDEAFTNNETEAETGSTLDQGAVIQRDFMGRIVNAASLPIDNVNITIGNKTAITDANGVFKIINATVKEKQAFVIANKPGYLKGMRSVVPTQNTSNVSIMLIAESLSGTVASGVDSEVTLGNGTKVSFDGAFKDENGNAYSGNVDVYMYHLDPSNPNINAIMPGNLQAINANEDERLLETYGMLNVELKGDSGQKLNIADGHVAEIEVPVDPAQSGVAPSSIPLWHFDEVNGHWIEDGEATLVGGKYVGEVSHFSWWNCDAQFPTVTLCLEVVDIANSPLANVKVELWRSNATYPRVGYSNGNGEICGLIPSNETLTLKAFDQCGVEVHSQSVGPFSTDTNLGQVVLPSVTAAVITGSLVDCSYVNITNGYVTLNYGSLYSDVAVTNGEFTFSVIECASQPTFTLEGIDYAAFQTTGDLSFNFSNTNIGNIIACNTVTEFISVQVDNNPVEYYLNNISSGQSSTSFLNVSGGNSSNGFFYLDGSNTALGTFDSTVYSIECSIMNIDYSQPQNISYNLNAYGVTGQYIDMNFSGTYIDASGTARTVVGSVHVLRD
ncbi:hypothetical protein [Lacinutrix sp. Bg11-31]|uniref:hypothetical protein n=1 Tax=Lacinutrix sp. Bg11-31 TaxID=2057808 RepID=UPI000C30E989|nr:hypothetical protein [Lacinutrix sp. Bg11-31]AUC81846.1 hypothetical protein CW733_06750 [Lacinutrix sp. Bg11-31]